MMERKNVSFGITVVLSVILLLFCTEETVMSREKAGCAQKKQYYASLEREYYDSMRNLLDAKGYHNSGVTIRWTADGEGVREYTVMIHHRKIDRLDDMGRRKLLRELSETEFADRQCTFRYEFVKV